MTEEKVNNEQCTCGGYHNEWIKPIPPVDFFEGIPSLANHYRALSDRVKDLEKWKLEMEKWKLKVSMKRNPSDDNQPRQRKKKQKKIRARKKRTTKKRVRR